MHPLLCFAAGPLSLTQMDSNDTKHIVDRLRAVRDRIAEAENRAGMQPGSVRLVGVTKNRTVEEMRAAVDAGLEDIGENRLQEAQDKLPSLDREVTRHFVGHLQRNKVRDVLGLCEVIQSVDSPRLAREIEKRAGREDMRVRVLMQVNTSGEESKYGVAPEKADELVELIAGCEHLRLEGLMTVGPLGGDENDTAASFAALREMRERYAAGGYPMQILSMGMTADFELAIAEGSNMVRIGTAIFGPRNY